MIINISLAADPPQLTTVRANYLKQIESATAPITAKYIEFLENLKKELGAKGELESALAVQNELDAIAGSAKVATISAGSDRIVVWNQNNNGKGDRGTERINVSLLLDGREVWSKKSIKVEWDQVNQGKVEIPTPSAVADTLRVEITRSVNDKGGLAEVEFFQGGRNVALGGDVRVSAVWENNPKHVGTMLADGVLSTYWLIPNNQEGWAEIVLKP
ncbi:MAG: hypothetical protein KBF76_12300 [Verrucomicrobiales bacterium]|nr:hypothetical protein [Verrucomicrobiales bacterium]